MERAVTSGENAGPDEPEFQAVRLGYAGNGQAVTFVLGETWNTDALGNPIDYAVTFVREFRYDGARARYLNREPDPVAVMNGDFTTFLSETWSDHEFDTIYGDYTVTDRVATNVRSYEPGLGTIDPWVSAGSADTRYLFNDLIGTLRQTVSSSGALDSLRVLTAFGERVAGPGAAGDPSAPDRFAYAGAWGYQTHADFPFLHVGHRYYDPSSGRFVQRDPIGIRGGLNAYAYTRNRPTGRFDPDGLTPPQDLDLWDGDPLPPLDGSYVPRPGPPAPPPPGQSIEEMQDELDRERLIIQACMMGLVGVVAGGIGGAIGGAVGGAVGGGIGGSAGVVIGSQLEGL